MSRNSERSLSSDSMETSDTSDSSGQDWGVFDGQMSPYGDEPLAEVCDDQSSDSDDEETDSNGLTPAVLAARLVATLSPGQWHILHFATIRAWKPPLVDVALQYR
ncbi:hypothetical protein P5673_007695 [Acropora cervicornis]|uniref:Uncharacterized protein n=1 Tax=Acropora cervicornis TaxID=6130 RepID=A0AAD9QVE4_ACRCE|nr:hypothetical protein P5673_007695 [Acropora cervicornis]